jgi:hypothetical protein
MAEPMAAHTSHWPDGAQPVQHVHLDDEQQHDDGCGAGEGRVVSKVTRLNTLRMS